MSVRYPLRSRAVAEDRHGSPSLIPVPKARKSTEIATSPAPSYRDVVMSRIASPVEDTRRLPDDQSGNVAVHVAQESDEDTGTSSNPGDDDTSPWTTVKRRRAYSLDSARKTSRNKNFIQKNYSKKLTKEQQTTVKTAADAMTTEQKKAFVKRHKVVSPERENAESGPSNPKGKGIDPREWGNLNLNEEELDIAAQTAALDSYKPRKASPEYKKEKGPRKKRGHGSRSRSKKSNNKPNPKGRQAESRAAAQIAPTSSLGLTLRNIKKKQRRELTTSPSESPSSSSSSSNGSSDEDESSSQSTDTESEPRSRRRHRRSRKTTHRRKRRSRNSSRNSTIRTKPPKEYDGTPDSSSYLRFVRESEAYVTDGRVHPDRCVRVVAYHLEGKAYDFYVQKVADNEEKWTLHEFYLELFNYCFPVDYRMQMRKKLNRCYQGENKTIIEYTYELLELFNMIGDISERDKVIKFWYGVKPIIQKGLWKDNLNPDVSTWEDVVARAEVIEIAENVAERRDRAHSSAHPQGTQNSHSNKFRRNKPHSSYRSSQALTLESNRSGNNESKGISGNNNNESRKPSAYQNNFKKSNPGKPSIGHKQPPFRRHENTLNTIRKTPRLSEKETAEYRAAGKCFRCGEVGHLANNCPTAHTVKSHTSGNRPPGIPNFNIGMNLVEPDDDEKEKNVISLGMMNFDSNNEELCCAGWSSSTSRAGLCLVPTSGSEVDWWERYPLREQPGLLARRIIGDCYGIIVEEILTKYQPYPGDDQWSSVGIDPTQRFSARRGKDGIGYWVRDRRTRLHTLLPQAYVENIYFNLPHWYAKLSAKKANWSKPLMSKIKLNHYYNERIGDAIHVVANKLLENGISSHFPSTNPETDSDSRFGIFLKDWGSNVYVITDLDFDLVTEISRDLLNNPTFDLIGWYCQIIRERNLFYNQYKRLHITKYHPEGTIDLNTNNVSNHIGDGDLFIEITQVLTQCQPFPGDEENCQPISGDRFVMDREMNNILCIYDRIRCFEVRISFDLVNWRDFSIGKWYAERCAEAAGGNFPWDDADEWMKERVWTDSTRKHDVEPECDMCNMFVADIFVGGVQVDKNKYPAIQRNAAKIKDN